ncbi:MAG: hypothetical protein NTY50_02570 [Methylobacter sp.]|nr:hypothetical protein [Methylobacter sp.]
MKLVSLFELLGIISVVSVSTGCTTLTSPARNESLSETNKVYWFDYAAERRGGFLLPKPTSTSPTAFSICAEPVPDVALEHTSEIAGSAKLPETVDAELKAKFANEVIQLAGRTQTILFLREAMYRLCEQGVNGNLAPGEVKELYNKVIDAAVLFSKASAAQEVKNALDSASDSKTQKAIQQFLTPQQQ